MTKLIKVAEITPEYTSVWECPKFIMDRFDIFRAINGKRAKLEHFFKQINCHYPEFGIKLISRAPIENSPKKTGLSADIIYYDEI